MSSYQYLDSKNEAQTADVDFRSGTLTVNGTSYRCDEEAVWLDGKRTPFWVHQSEDKVSVWLDGVVHHLTVKDPRKRSTSSADAQGSNGKVAAQMPGKVLAVEVKVGDRVQAGQSLVLMESMKMELSLDAPLAGTVESVSVKLGEMVSQGQLLVQLILDESE